VVLFWLGSMTWLVWTKVWPANHRNPDPPYVGRHDAQAGQPSRVVWDIHWQGRVIGSVGVVTGWRPNGSAVVHSRLEFVRLPVAQLADELLGSLGGLLSLDDPAGRDSSLTLSVATRLNFDVAQRLESFQSSVDVEGAGKLFEIRGQLTGSELDLQVTSDAMPTPVGGDGSVVIFHQRMRLPQEAVWTDMLTPQPRLSGLEVGQTWIQRTYRPFAPLNPLGVLEARVARSELVAWEGELEVVHVVSFSEWHSHRPTAASLPCGQLWVRDDGTVIRQRTLIGRLELEFRRRDATWRGKETR
jgi:hypothetical protein